MATSNIARPSTLLASSEVDVDPVTLLEERSTQLYSMLCYCHGNGQQQEDVGPDHRNNVIWLASVLARDVKELIQICLSRKP